MYTRILTRTTQAVQARTQTSSARKSRSSVQINKKSARGQINKIEVCKFYHTTATMQRNVLEATDYHHFDEDNPIAVNHPAMDLFFEDTDKVKAAMENLPDHRTDDDHDNTKEIVDNFVATAKASELFDESQIKTIVETLSKVEKSDGSNEIRQLQNQSAEWDVKLGKVRYQVEENRLFETKAERHGLYEDRRRDLDVNACAWIVSARDPTNASQALCAVNYWRYYASVYGAPTKRLLHIFITDVIPSFFEDKEFQPWEGIKMRPSSGAVYPEDLERATALLDSFETKLRASAGKDLKPSCSVACKGTACPCWLASKKDWAAYEIKRKEAQPGWENESAAEYARIQKLPKAVRDNYLAANKMLEAAQAENDTKIPEHLPTEIVSKYDAAKKELEDAFDKMYPHSQEHKMKLLESYYRGKITWGQARQGRLAVISGDQKTVDSILALCGPKKFRGIDYSEEALDTWRRPGAEEPGEEDVIVPGNPPFFDEHGKLRPYVNPDTGVSDTEKQLEAFDPNHDLETNEKIAQKQASLYD